MTYIYYICRYNYATHTFVFAQLVANITITIFMANMGKSLQESFQQVKYHIPCQQLIHKVLIKDF